MSNTLEKKDEITNISVAAAAKVCALIGFFLALLMLLPYAVAALFSATRSHRGWLWGGILAGVGLTMAPLLGIAYGAVCGAAVAFSYNFVASRWGGIQVTSREVTRPAKRLHARTADASRHADADAAHRQSPPSAP